MTTVDPTLDAKKPCHVFYDDFDKGIYEMCEYFANSQRFFDGYMIDTDDPEVFKNAPVCLQLVGRTLEEEAIIKMTEIVDGALAAAKQAHQNL